MRMLGHDLRQAMRSLRRDPGTSAFAVAIAGLGIGACVTVFSICNAILLRPLPFAQPQRLVWIANGTSENLSAQTVQVANVEALATRSHSFEAIAGFSPFFGPGDVRLTGRGEPERLTAVPVTRGFLPLLGIQPLAGRFFTESEARHGAPGTVILDYGFWRRRFDARRDIVGESLILDGQPVTVIGIAPPTFDFAATFMPGRAVDLFRPFPMSPETNRQGNTLALVGRLRPGVSIAQAQAEATAIGSPIQSGNVDGTWRNAFDPRVAPLRERVSGRVQGALLVLAGAVTFLMLLVCANLSNLLLLRASARQRELAVRTALGAERWQLAGQMLIESLLLGGTAATLGVACAVAGTAVVSRIQGTAIPLLRDVRVDSVVLAFAVLAAAGTALAVGLLPALRSTAVPLTTLLANGGRTLTAGGRAWLRGVTVVVEIAMVCVLLTGAGLLARSFGRVLDVPPGFTATNVVAVRVDPGERDMDRARRSSILRDLARSVAAIPGVQAWGLTDALPLGDNFGWRRWGARRAGDAGDAERRDGQSLQPLVRMIDGGYLRTMRIPLLAGRDFTEGDNATSEPVMLVNDRLAAAMFPSGDAVGSVVRAGGVERRVVGIVGSVRYFALDRDVEPEMYMPLGQQGGFQSVDLVVRSDLPAATVTSSLRRALRAADPSLPLGDFRTMEALVDRSLFARRFVVTVVIAFAAFGLLLSALGIYAVIARSVSERTQEIGIRMALGATPGAVQARILGETGVLLAGGVAVGVPLAWIAARAIRGFLFDVGMADPATVMLVFAALGAVGLAGAFVPALRATRVDPASTLRKQT